MLRVRRELAYGEQQDYFDAPDCIGWTRAGDDEHGGGVAVVMSNRDAGAKRMQLPNSNAAYRDATGNVDQVLATDDDGCAEFTCAPGSISVWVPATFGE